MSTFAGMLDLPLYKKILSYFWPIHVERGSSALNRVLDVDLYNGKLMLNTENANYSFGRLHDVMTKALEVAHGNNCAFRKVLILGYGGGSAAQIIHKKYNVKSDITAVEYDQLVIDFAKKWFYTSGVNIIQGDAFGFIENSAEAFDLIICDIFYDVHMPDEIKTKHFYQKCHKLLSENGHFMQNLMLKVEEADEQYKKFATIFSNAEKMQLFRSNSIFQGMK